MRSHRKASAAVAALAALAATAVASTSHADSCASLNNPVYVTGSSAVEPFMKVLGAALYPATTIVYQKPGSCVGVDAIVKGTVMSGSAQYFPTPGDGGAAPVGVNCDLPPGDAGVGQPADLGVSDVFPASCAGGTADPATVGDFWGPNQIMVFVTPQKATASVNISAEAAHFVMGQPATGKTIAPWVSSSKLAIRTFKSGTQTMIGAAIHLDATAFIGTDATSASGVQTAITSAQNTDPNPEQALGILSTGEADTVRSAMKVLAFQPWGQKCAFWPDSSLTTFDKKWVRTGEYPIWGPLHLLAKVASAGAAPTNPEVAKIVSYFAGTAVPPGGSKTTLIDLEIGAHTVPQCAMKVKRTTEVGPTSPNTPADPCGCYFEFKATGAAPASCHTCTADADCADGGANMICSYGYCEAK